MRIPNKPRKACVSYAIYVLLLVSCTACKKHSNVQAFVVNQPVLFEDILTSIKQTNLAEIHSSFDGAGIAVGDINRDGLPDLFVCSKLGQQEILLNKGSLPFEDITLQANLCAEDFISSSAIFTDVNGDGFVDLYLCGNTTGMGECCNPPDRLYINTHNNCFTLAKKALPYQWADTKIHTCITAADYDADGDIDLFIGTKLRQLNSWQAGGYILQNDGQGNFTDITDVVCPALVTAGNIYDAQWVDYDKDGLPDLITASGHSSAVVVFHNTGIGLIEEKDAISGLSLLNCNRLLIEDVNGDGYPDIITGSNNELAVENYNFNKKIYTIDYEQIKSKKILLECLRLYNSTTAFLHANKGRSSTLKYYDTCITHPYYSINPAINQFTRLTGVLINNKKRGFTFSMLPAEPTVLTRICY